MSNKDEFNRIAASVLENLDESFPIPIRLYAKDYVDETSEESRQLFVYTVEFLSKENLLTFGGGSDEGHQIHLTVLTGKGLSLLNSVPEILQEKSETTPFRQKIKNALKAGSKEALKMVMSQFIQAVVKGEWHLPHLNS
ncbi:MAG TPA: hypothetical protein VF779_09325 [Pyrinomonadaceae bacterium]